MICCENLVVRRNIHCMFSVEILKKGKLSYNKLNMKKEGNDYETKNFIRSRHFMYVHFACLIIF